MKKISKNNIIFIILVVLTLIRLWLGVRTPLLLQADARYDDFLFVRYAEELLNGNWLGNDSLSLAKSASFSVILALGYLLGIPYNFGLYVLYILACILISIAFYYIIKNKYFCYILYLFLLYSPIMFHEENVQKVYRGGYIVIFAIIVFASVIAQFGISFERNVGKKGVGVGIGRKCGAAGLLADERRLYLDSSVCMRGNGYYTSFIENFSWKNSEETADSGCLSQFFRFWFWLAQFLFIRALTINIMRIYHNG